MRGVKRGTFVVIHLVRTMSSGDGWEIQIENVIFSFGDIYRNAILRIKG